MRAMHCLSRFSFLGIVLFLCGCSAFSNPKLDALQAQNRAWAEQSRAQLVEIENLKNHSDQLVEKFQQTQADLARLEERFGLDKQQLANYKKEREVLRNQFQGAINGHSYLRPESSRELAEVTRNFPSLRFDPITGIAKLRSDVLFDSGKTELKPAARDLLRQMVRTLKSPSGKELKVMVVGHTDNRRIAKRPGRDKYPNNFYLSTARANSVADQLQGFGLEKERLVVAGCGSHEPIAPNSSLPDQQKNRRVEIFVMAREVPVVGWVESMPSLYY